jgi:hypothetical protein
MSLPSYDWMNENNRRRSVGAEEMVGVTDFNIEPELVIVRMNLNS